MQGPFVALEALRANVDAKLRRNPTYVDVFNLRALVHVFQGDLDAARDDLAEALRLHPGYVEALLNLTWLHTLRDEPGAFRAILHSRHVQDLDPASRTHLELLGTLRWQGPTDALARVEQLPAEVRSHPWLQLDELLAAVLAGDRARLAGGVKLLASGHDGLEWHLESAGLVRSGEPQPAWRQWVEVQRGNPGIARLFQAQAALLDDEPHSNAVQELLHWSVAVSLDACEYWLGLGDLLDRNRQDAQAEEAFRRAAAIDPDRPEPHLRLGQLFAAQARPRDAVAQFEAIRQQRPQWPDVRYLLGLLYEELGHLDEAENEYRAALTSNPEYVLTNVALGNLLAAQGRHQEAVRLLETMRESGVDSADLETWLASLYDHLGQEAAARRARERAVALAQEAG